MGLQPPHFEDLGGGLGGGVDASWPGWAWRAALKAFWPPAVARTEDFQSKSFFLLNCFLIF